MRVRARRIGAVAAAGLLSLAVGVRVAQAVDTDMAISTTAIDFGSVDVGSTASVAATLTNTGGDPFGPINMFGGAPPTDAFTASQNCQGTTLPAGGSCQVTYVFMPPAESPYTDMSNFTVSETPSQTDGEDFSVSLSGVGGTATTTTTSTTTTTTPTTTTPTDTTGSTQTTSAGAATPTTGQPLGEIRATVEHDEVEPGQEQEATASGFQPGEEVSAVQQPGALDLGSQTADDDGEVEFSWTIPETQALGTYEFVATGADSGSVTASYTVASSADDKDDDDSGMSPLLIAALVLLALLAIGALVWFAYRRGQQTGMDTDANADATTGTGVDPDATAETPVAPDPPPDTEPHGP